MTENTGTSRYPEGRERAAEEKQGVGGVDHPDHRRAGRHRDRRPADTCPRGRTIRITFQAGEGIEAGKTAVKYKDIEIGLVTEVELTNDRSKILVTAEMEKSVEDMLDNDARFWIVKPRVTLSGVSGIGALISGNYIGFEPGKSPAEAARLRRARNPPSRQERPAGP